MMGTNFKTDKNYNNLGQYAHPDKASYHPASQNCTNDPKQGHKHLKRDSQKICSVVKRTLTGSAHKQTPSDVMAPLHVREHIL